VVLAFGAESVGVLVTSSMPGWSAARTASYEVVYGRRLAAGDGPAAMGGTAAAEESAEEDGGNEGGGDEAGGGLGGGEGGVGTAAAGAADAVRSRGGSPDPQAAQGGDDTHDALYHVRIRSSNFSRTVDFVSLGERGLVELVQLQPSAPAPPSA
jgi:hypothetical protein